MMTVRSLIAKWPKPSMTRVSADCNVKWTTAHQWRLRNHIPPEYWPALVESAKRNGVKGVTLAALAEMTAAHRGKVAPVEARKMARAG